MPSSHLSSVSPFSSCPQSLLASGSFQMSQLSTLRMRWPKYWHFSLSISPSNEHPVLVSFRVDWLDLHEVQGTMETVRDFSFLGSKITADGDCSHEIKRCLLLVRKTMTNLDSIFKSRDITLPTKGHLVKAMVFPVLPGELGTRRRGRNSSTW